MSVRLAKLAVALLYAATIVVIIKEFSGHGHGDSHKPPERSPEAIQTGLVAEAVKFVLKPPDQQSTRSDLTGEIKRENIPFCLVLISIIFIDTNSHEHPTEHQHLQTRRRGKKFDWREWVLISLRHQIACNSPPPDAVSGHRPTVRRVGKNQIVTT